MKEGTQEEEEEFSHNKRQYCHTWYGRTRQISANSLP